MAALRAGVEEALERFAAGDVVGARRRWAKLTLMLTRLPPGKRGKARLITHAGKTQNVTAWARELGWTPQALCYRLEVMPYEEALTPRKK